jgi:hypothetical protein
LILDPCRHAGFQPVEWRHEIECSEGPKISGDANHRVKGGIVRIIPILIAITALPLMALGQETDQQQGAAQGQTNENKEKAPAKKKKARAAHEQGKPEARPATGANVRGGTKAEGRSEGVKKTEAGAAASESARPSKTGRSEGVKKTEAGTRSSKTQTKVNVQEFKSRHREVFTLGRHPKDFFVQRFGANHFRLIGNTYFVFVDGCWVAVDVAGFVFVERVICAGDPDFIVVY